MTRSNELDKKRVKPRTKSPPESKQGSARSGLQWTSLVGQLTGHPAAFAVVLIYAGLWLAFDRQHFDYNAVATLAVWIMTLLIQRSNRRDTLALHAKLDELLALGGDLAAFNGGFNPALPLSYYCDLFAAIRARYGDSVEFYALTGIT